MLRMLHMLIVICMLRTPPPQVVMYTPCITVGVSYELETFDQCFVYATAHSVIPRIVMQAIHRVRSLRGPDHLVVCVNARGPRSSYLLTTAQVRRAEARRLAALRDRWDDAAAALGRSLRGDGDGDGSGGDRDDEPPLSAAVQRPRQAPPFYLDNYVHLATETNVALAAYDQVLKGLLRDEGYDVVPHVVLEGGGQADPAAAAGPAEAEAALAARLRAVPDVDDASYRELHAMVSRGDPRGPTVAERLMHERKIFRMAFARVGGRCPGADVAELWVACKLSKAPSVARRQARDLCQELLGDDDADLVADAARWGALEMAPPSTAAAEHVRRLCRCLGLAHSLDTGAQGPTQFGGELASGVWEHLRKLQVLGAYVGTLASPAKPEHFAKGVAKATAGFLADWAGVSLAKVGPRSRAQRYGVTLPEGARVARVIKDWIDEGLLVPVGPRPEPSSESGDGGGSQAEVAAPESEEGAA